MNDDSGREYPDNWWEQIEPPDGDEISAVTDDERRELEPDEFWSSRPVLQHLHDFAKSRRVGPWAVLGAAMARVIAATPPSVQLPATIGSEASLNLFVGMVGKSGDGKDIAQRVAREALELDIADPFPTHPLGSGEGLAHMFMRRDKANLRNNNQPDLIQHTTAVVVTIGEIDSLGAQAKRQASTVMPQLRQAAMGEQLGFFYVDDTKRMIVPEHQYRLCLIVGIQPRRAEILIDDVDGGTPQRFLWLPAGDPEVLRNPPAGPAPMVWTPPHWLPVNGRAIIALPDVAQNMIIEAHIARTKEQADALDGHALLTRAKVAAGLTILDERTHVTDDDWHLSGTVMAISDGQRRRCVDAKTDKARERNTAQALVAADQAVIVSEHVDDAAVIRTCQSIKKKLASAYPDGLLRKELRAALSSLARPHLETALDRLQHRGEIHDEPVEYQGQQSARYFLR